MSFEDQQKPNEQTTDTLTFKVGERSFNAESAATKIEAGDAHITKIESENQGYQSQIAALQLQVDQGTKIEDALAKLQQQPQDSQSTEVTPSVSEDQIGAIATKQIEAVLANRLVEANAATAQALADKTFKETGAKLYAKYGDKTDEAMATQAQKLGISTDAVFKMAKDPATAQLLLNAMDVPATPAQATPNSSFASPQSNSDAPAHKIDWTKSGSKHIFEALQAARLLEN